MVSTELSSVQELALVSRTVCLLTRGYRIHTRRETVECSRSGGSADEAADKALNSTKGGVELAEGALDGLHGDSRGRGGASDSERSDDSGELHCFGLFGSLKSELLDMRMRGRRKSDQKE